MLQCAELQTEKWVATKVGCPIERALVKSVEGLFRPPVNKGMMADMFFGVLLSVNTQESGEDTCVVLLALVGVLNRVSLLYVGPKGVCAHLFLTPASHSLVFIYPHG